MKKRSGFFRMLGVKLYGALVEVIYFLVLAVALLIAGIVDLIAFPIRTIERCVRRRRKKKLHSENRF